MVADVGTRIHVDLSYDSLLNVYASMYFSLHPALLLKDTAFPNLMYILYNYKVTLRLMAACNTLN